MQGCSAKSRACSWPDFAQLVDHTSSSPHRECRHPTRPCKLSCLRLQEFGVFQAVSTNKTARWRKQHCHSSCPPLYGFDTFEGLPEVWEADAGDDRFQQVRTNKCLLVLLLLPLLLLPAAVCVYDLGLQSTC